MAICLLDSLGGLCRCVLAVIAFICRSTPHLRCVLHSQLSFRLFPDASMSKKLGRVRNVVPRRWFERGISTDFTETSSPSRAPTWTSTRKLFMQPLISSAFSKWMLNCRHVSLHQKKLLHVSKVVRCRPPHCLARLRRYLTR